MPTTTKSEAETTHQVETDLIKACSTTVASIGRRSEIRRLAADCRDWDYVLQACRDHCVSSLVCHTLEANAMDLVPDKAKEALRARFRANARRNLFLTQELLQLVRKFRENGIEVIPFKGPMLAIAAYGNVALREFGDLDVLVHKENFHLARTLMSRWGYLSASGDEENAVENFFKSQLGSDHFREDGKVILELHWSFIQTWLGFNVDIQTVWVLSRPFPVGSVPVLNLPADITLLYLCAHGAKHRWNRLCWVIDVAELLRASTGLDWDSLLAQAARSGCLRTLFIGLNLAQTLLGASIPGRVMARIAEDKQAVLLARGLGDGMFDPGKDFVKAQLGWKRDWFNIRAKERWREKLIYLGQLSVWVCRPSEKDRAWVALPSGLLWLYFVIRPIRVACQYRQTTIDTL
jgi:Uncharacterised nucleotidyltransferase